MKSYFVSLTRDLLGVYIEYRAESEQAVRQYLEREYYRNGEWRLPWCAVYESVPPSHTTTPVILQAKCGTIYEEVTR